MKRLFILSALIVAAFSLTACNDDNGHAHVTSAAKQALLSMYPTATDIEWERRGGYSIAEFEMGTGDNRQDCTAWFDNKGVWYMTEFDIAYSALPDAVKSAFTSSDYASWQVDDVDMLERASAEVIYVIEVENESATPEREVDLYYSPEGVLVKAVVDAPGTDNDYTDFIPSPIPQAIAYFIEAEYPMAQIIEVDVNRNTVEVDIVEQGIYRELLFDADYNWIQTSTDVRLSDVPEIVTAALAASEFATYEIDDIEFIETPSAEYYLFELENGESDVTLKINAEGVIID